MDASDRDTDPSALPALPRLPPRVALASLLRSLAVLTAFGLLLTAGCGAPTPSEDRAETSWPQRPNIVWISAEDMNARLGAYGDSVARTPNLDRLAREGVRYANAFTVAGVCAPNRSSIITGMYQNSIGTHHMRTTHEAPGLPTPYSAVPPPYVKTFTEYLRADGYFTTNNAKTDYQFETPETAWDENGGRAHWRSDEREQGQPFFSVFNLGVTHESAMWGRDGDAPATDPEAVSVPPYLPDTDSVRLQIARHYDNIAAMDRRVGELLAQLEEDGLADETLVVFWSDHGDGLPRHKRWIYDSGIHVPVIARWPGVFEPGTVDRRLISTVDLGPTMLSVAGVRVPAHVQGRPFLGPQDEGEREYVYAARDRFDEAYDMVRAVRDERFKYIRNYFPEKPYVLHIPYRNRNVAMRTLLRRDAAGTLTDVQELWMRDARPVEELYDTRADSHEVRNLAADPAYREVLERMRAEMDAWMDRIDDRGDVAEDQMVADMYPGDYPKGPQPITATPVVVPRLSRALPVPVREEIALNGPGQVTVHAGTHGASIAYTFESGEDPHWELYSGPLTIEESVTLRTKAIRYGYAESPVREVGITVE